jgi:murein DD-endopeptidase MepM/ murein hydrolase activator NlpD
MKKNFLIIIAGLSMTAAAFLFGIFVERNNEQEAVYTAESSVEKVKAPIYKYGINLSEFVVVDQKVEKNEVFADILLKNNVAYESVKYLLKESKDIFNYNKIRAGNNYTVLGEKTKAGFVPKKIVYEENKVNYVIFNLDDSLYIYRGENKVERKHQEVAGIINGSLYETFDNCNVPPSLAVRLAEIFSCTVDFYKIQAGDKFKIIYDEDFVEGKSVGVGEISAALFNSRGKDYQAFYYEKDKEHEGEYYDENGNSMHKQFLKAPVKFARISSRFNLHRFHPVSMVWRAHLGTDYAAGFGTPIIATADGVVEEAKFGVYNGNYVKIRHNGQYKTQYLHMSKIGKGIRPGRKVHQGEVIGYVGATGLATGPHVCYRFWKDGKQVDPLQQKLAFSEPLPKKYKNDFMARTNSLQKAIDNLAYGSMPVIEKSAETILEETAFAIDSFVEKHF